MYNIISMYVYYSKLTVVVRIEVTFAVLNPQHATSSHLLYIYIYVIVIFIKSDS